MNIFTSVPTRRIDGKEVRCVWINMSKVIMVIFSHMEPTLSRGMVSNQIYEYDRRHWVYLFTNRNGLLGPFVMGDLFSHWIWKTLTRRIQWGRNLNFDIFFFFKAVCACDGNAEHNNQKYTSLHQSWWVLPLWWLWCFMISSPNDISCRFLDWMP